MAVSYQNRLLQAALEQGVLQQEQQDSLAGLPQPALAQRLLQEAMLDEEQLQRLYADMYQLRYVDLSQHTVDERLYEILPLNVAIKLGVMPYAIDDNTLSVVAHDAFDITLEDKLAASTGREIALLLGTRSQVERALGGKQGSERWLRNVTDEFRPLIANASDRAEQALSMEQVDAESAPAIKMINSLIYAGLQKRASDIHIETYDYGMDIKYRIDGVLYNATERLGRDMHASLVSRIKVMASLDITESNRPQDGRFKLFVESKSIDFRVSIIPGAFGENVNIRILDRETILHSLQQLNLSSMGMESAALERFRRAINEPHGMVLVTGPTGSGKTTTLYAAVSELNNGEEKIITVEDPVEYQLDGIVQIPVNEAKGMTFATGLRSILRHDPDKILIGEIRDRETAEIAVQSALTGHLVLSSLHANSGFDVISRFLNMGVETASLLPALNCIVSQRLVRKVCERCKQEVTPGKEELSLAGLDEKEVEQHRFYQGAGCPACDHTGYNGREAIHEVLYFNDELKEMVQERRRASEIKHAARQLGMQNLREAALAKVYRGITTLHEFNRVTFTEQVG